MNYDLNKMFKELKESKKNFVKKVTDALLRVVTESDEFHYSDDVSDFVDHLTDQGMQMGNKVFDTNNKEEYSTS